MHNLHDNCLLWSLSVTLGQISPKMSRRKCSDFRFSRWRVQSLLACTAVFLIGRRPTFQRCVRHDAGGSTHLWNVGRHPIKNTAVHSGRLNFNKMLTLLYILTVRMWGSAVNVSKDSRPHNAAARSTVQTPGRLGPLGRPFAYRNAHHSQWMESCDSSLSADIDRLQPHCISCQQPCAAPQSNRNVSSSCVLVLCYVMLCYVMLCYAMLCYAMLCYAMLCYVMLCYAMLCYVMLCFVMYACIIFRVLECLCMLCWYVMLCLYA
jgi:hypothetical protein